MATNFDFLRTTDKNLYEIISDAEKLYRDEYFEQCMSQTRRFAENVCKNVLGSKRTTEKTFDQMLATLKDNCQGSVQEKEFIDDLYFLKKCGNESVHSSSVKQCGIDALECLRRAFEVSINYSVYYKKEDKRNLDLHYDIELLATGKASDSKGKKTLAKRYQEAKKASKMESEVRTTAKSVSKTSKTTPKKTKHKTPQQSKNLKSYPPKKKVSAYWVMVGVFSIITLMLILFLLITQ